MTSFCPPGQTSVVGSAAVGGSAAANADGQAADASGANGASAAAATDAGAADDSDDDEEREYNRQAAGTWLPILEKLCGHVRDGRLLVLTMGSQRLLNPIPMVAVGETPGGNLVGLITALVYT